MGTFKSIIYAIIATIIICILVVIIPILAVVASIVFTLGISYILIDDDRKYKASLLNKDKEN